MAEKDSFRALREDKIIETAAKLQKRIAERFPESGLSQVADGLVSVTRDARVRSRTMHRPILWLRLLCVIVLLAVAWIITEAVLDQVALGSDFPLDMQTVEATISTCVFLGAAVLFLVTLEARMKRSRAIVALHELRAMAHVIDMHQLTKDPERTLHKGPSTASSPDRRMNAFELGRYLDYCSEMLAIISKVAAIYGQGTHDDAALRSVDQVETLTTGLARKVWQKMVILDQLTRRADEEARGTL